MLQEVSQLPPPSATTFGQTDPKNLMTPQGPQAHPLAGPVRLVPSRANFKPRLSKITPPYPLPSCNV